METLALGVDDYPRSAGSVIAEGAQLIARADAPIGLATAAGGRQARNDTPVDSESRPRAVANSSGSGVYRNEFVTGTQRVAAKHKEPGKREKIGSGNSARFVRRDERGHFTSEQVDVGRSIAADKRQHAKNSAPKRMKDRGD